MSIRFNNPPFSRFSQQLPELWFSYSNICHYLNDISSTLQDFNYLIAILTFNCLPQINMITQPMNLFKDIFKQITNLFNKGSSFSYAFTYFENMFVIFYFHLYRSELIKTFYLQAVENLAFLHRNSWSVFFL
jgi:hypothetical protein